MADQRGRSPSGGNQQLHLNHSQSPSPNDQQDSNSSHPKLQFQTDTSQASDLQFSNDSYSSTGGLQFDSNATFSLNQQTPSFTLDQSFGQHNEFESFKQEPLFGQQSPFGPDLLNPNDNTNGDFQLYPASSLQGDVFDPNYFMNTSSPNASSQSVNPADLMSDMSSPMSHAPTPPNLLQPDITQQLGGSAHQSPSFNQVQFSRSPGHSRHASLGPESAAYQGSQQLSADWTGLMQQPQFMTHRRSPSEFSDVSSAAPSPNLVQHDTFDSIEQQYSPLLNPQDPTGVYMDGLGFNNFSLADSKDHRHTSPHQAPSPAHNPSLSPRLGPQRGNMMAQQFLQGFGFPAGSSVYNNQINSQMNEQYGNQQRNGSLEMGQAQQMVPPEINVEFAPASRQNSFEPPKLSVDQDALSPPERGRRRRAASDPFNNAGALVRPTSPSGSIPSPGSGAGSLSPASARSLSPMDRLSVASPHRRRQSTSALPKNRDYILGLADPEYQAASGGSENGGAKRVQKHPATFQCHLCTKRFTRAYNLRSHLRTHTDERPFVCTVCGKAFARQHDRKRHEGLHSGEKKFVCKGELKQGGQWGCGRRFARADALGRHFRSEAGRICIKPLLDEEAVERQRQWQDQQLQNMTQNMQQPQPLLVDNNGFPMDASGNYALPAALLAQYPALATLSWADLPQGDVGMDDEISGRSSFDASGSEYYDEGGDDGYLSSGPGPGPQQYGQGQQQGFTNDY